MQKINYIKYSIKNITDIEENISFNLTPIISVRWRCLIDYKLGQSYFRKEISFMQGKSFLREIDAIRYIFKRND